MMPDFTVQKHRERTSAQSKCTALSSQYQMMMMKMKAILCFTDVSISFILMPIALALFCRSWSSEAATLLQTKQRRQKPTPAKARKCQTKRKLVYDFQFTSQENLNGCLLLSQYSFRSESLCNHITDDSSHSIVGDRQKCGSNLFCAYYLISGYFQDLKSHAKMLKSKLFLMFLVLDTPALYYVRICKSKRMWETSRGFREDKSLKLDM